MNLTDDPQVDISTWAYQNLLRRDLEWTNRVNPRNVTASANVNQKDDLIRADSTGGAVTMTLESAIGCDGRPHTLKKIDASGNAVAFACTGGQTIDGAATLSTTTRYVSFTVKSNGSNWDVI